MTWPIHTKSKPDLIFFDPPYFDKKAADYGKDSISNLPRDQYLQFFEHFFRLAHQHTTASARIAFLNADWRDFQGSPALEENPKQAVTLFDYGRLLQVAGWEITHIIDCPLSTQRFHPHMVSAMQKRRTLGVVRRSLIIARKN